MTHDEQEILTSQETDAAIESLIEWFESKNIQPRNAACVMIRLLAEQMVSKTHDLNELKRAIGITIRLLAAETTDILKEEGALIIKDRYDRPV